MNSKRAACWRVCGNSCWSSRTSALQILPNYICRLKKTAFLKKSFAGYFSLLFLVLRLVSLCSFDASSWPRLSHRGSSKREGTAVAATPSRLSTFDGQLSSGTPSSTPAVTSIVWTHPQWLTSTSSSLHVELQEDDQRGTGLFFFSPKLVSTWRLAKKNIRKE